MIYRVGGMNFARPENIELTWVEIEAQNEICACQIADYQMGCDWRTLVIFDDDINTKFVSRPLQICPVEISFDELQIITN